MNSVEVIHAETNPWRFLELCSKGDRCNALSCPTQWGRGVRKNKPGISHWKIAHGCATLKWNRKIKLSTFLNLECFAMPNSILLWDNLVLLRNCVVDTGCYLAVIKAVIKEHTSVGKQSCVSKLMSQPGLVFRLEQASHQEAIRTYDQS